MNILISGGLGFIGSYMVDNFLKRGYKVGIIARRVPSYLKNLASKVDLYKTDISKPLDFKLREKYAIFIHLAAANDMDSQDASIALLNTVLGVKNCLDFCLRNKINNFFYFSTFQVYGVNSGVINERSPLICKNNYAITHMFGEEYIRMYHRNFGLDYIIARPTNVYGAPLNKNIDRWSLVPNCFCKEAFKNRLIILRSSGKQMRDFISLEDISNLTSILCENFVAQKNKVFNFARGKGNPILNVSKMVQKEYKKIFKKECKLKISSRIPASSVRLFVSTKKIKDLNYIYSNEHSLEKEISRIFQLLKKG